MSSPRGGRARVTIGLLVITAVILLTVDGRGTGPLHSVRSAVGSVLSPLGGVASSIGRPFSNAWNAAFAQDDIEKQNEALREENDRLRGELTASAVASQQLEQLLQLVDIPFVGNTPVVHTRVASGTVGNFGQTIELDKGSSSGIERNMPVVTGEGLIGKVVEVYDTRCVVSLLSSGSFKVGFLVVGTSAIGIAEGTGTDGSLRGFNIDARLRVTTDQIVVTNGLADSPFPANIPIGTITDIHSNDGTIETTIDIRMLADVHDLTYADVILWKSAP